MRPRLLLAALSITIIVAACKKDQPQACGGNYQSAIVLHGTSECQQYDFLLQVDGGDTYRVVAGSLPASFQQVGLKVCVTYIIVPDLGMCPCCGGTRLNIQSIQQQ